jgi:small-conductance mechanosensitive channel
VTDPRITLDFDSVLQRLTDEAFSLLSMLPLLLLALLVIALGWMLGNWVSRRTVLERVGSRNPFLRELARTTVRWLISGAGVLVALQILDATALVGAVLGTAGLFGVALGFAFKDTLENYLAGILMSLRQPFAPRDHVVIAGNEGLVISMTSRATILMTLDGNHLRLPNALVFRSVTLNYTRNPSRRFEFDIGVGVNEDLVLAQRLGVAQLERLGGVMKQPPPRAYIAALGDSNVQVRFQGWVDQRTNEFLLVKSEAIRQVKLALERQGMDMPEPIYRVQINRRNGVGLGAGVAASPPAEPLPTSATSASAAPEVDTRAVRDLQNQIDAEQRLPGARELLDPSAPRE